MTTIKKIVIRQDGAGLFTVQVDSTRLYNAEEILYRPGPPAMLYAFGPGGHVVGSVFGRVEITRTVIDMKWAGPEPEGYPVPPMLVYEALAAGVPIKAPPAGAREKLFMSKTDGGWGFVGAV